MDASLNRTLQILDGQTALARALGISPQAVQQWERIPPRHALKVEEITEGKVTALDILREAQTERAA